MCVRPQDSAPVPDGGLLRVLQRAPSSLTPVAGLLRWTEDEGEGQSGLLQVTVTSEAPSGGAPQASGELCVLFRLCPRSWTPSVLR